MLDEIVAAINRFTAALPEGATETIASWTVVTYCLYPCGLRFAPRLMVRKPVSNAGGTNLLSVMLYLVRRQKYNYRYHRRQLSQAIQPAAHRHH